MKSASCCKTLLGNLMAMLGFLLIGGVPCVGQSNSTGSVAAAPKTRIILDTDIGDDVDDAFALGLALQSPEVETVGVTTAWGDTALRARMVRRMLLETGRAGIPVAEGIATKSPTTFSQARWAEAGSDAKSRVDAVALLLNE